MPRKNPIAQREIEISTRLRKFRQSIGLSRVRFAQNAGVDSSLLSRIEHLRAPLKYQTFRALNAKYYITPTWLATGSGFAKHSIPFDDAVFADAIDSALPFSEIYSTVLSGTVSSVSYEFSHEIKMCQNFVNSLQNFIKSESPEKIAMESPKNVSLLLNLVSTLSKLRSDLETIVNQWQGVMDRQNEKATAAKRKRDGSKPAREKAG